MAHFLVAKGATKSRPLLSLDTYIELGMLHIAKATQEQAKPSCTNASSADPVIAQLTSEYHDVFWDWGNINTSRQS